MQEAMLLGPSFSFLMVMCQRSICGWRWESCCNTITATEKVYLGVNHSYVNVSICEQINSFRRLPGPQNSYTPWESIPFNLQIVYHFLMLQEISDK